VEYKSIEINKASLDGRNASSSASSECCFHYRLNEHYQGPKRLELRHRPQPPKGKEYATEFNEGKQATIIRTSWTGKAVVKVFRRGEDAREAERALRLEAELLSQFNHPNILTFYGIIDLRVQMEEFGLHDHLTQGIVLQQCRTKNFGKIPFFDEAGKFKAMKYKRMVRQVFDGLEAIHREGVLHFDIKPENILVHKASGLVKIADFGYSVKLTDASTVLKVLNLPEPRALLRLNCMKGLCPALRMTCIRPCVPSYASYRRGLGLRSHTSDLFGPCTPSIYRQAPLNWFAITGSGGLKRK